MLILTHDYPDPDSIASAFALHYLAKTFYGIDSKIAYGGIISRIENRYMVTSLKIPIHKLRAEDLREYSNTALVDTQPNFTNNSFPKGKHANIVIDQHSPAFKGGADLSIVDIKRNATCEILAEALLAVKRDLPVTLATALAYGILTDTLNLSRVVRPSVFKIYLKILSFCDMIALIRLQNPPRPPQFFKVLSRSIHDTFCYGKLVVCHMGAVDDIVSVAHIADFLCAYKGADWVLCTGRFNGRLYTSLRSVKPSISAFEILRDAFGDIGLAGGHGPIAGGNLKVGKNTTARIWKQYEKNMTGKLLNRLHISSKVKVFKPFV